MTKVLTASSILALALTALHWTVPGGALLPTARAAGGADPAALAKSCLRCHEGELSLSEVGVNKLTEQIAAIRSGATAHPPGLKDLTDAQIEGIAAVLGKK